MRFLPILLSLTALAAARCGTRPPSANVRSSHKYYQDKEDRDAASPATRDVFDVTIDTYVHVIHTNNTENVNPKTIIPRINKQMDVLNDKYKEAGFSFNLITISYTANNKWQRIEEETDTEFEVKSALRRGDYTTLNIYYGTIDDDLLGYATFPDNVNKHDFQRDGVVIEPSTLPGGKEPFDKGMITVHEVGHWLNLFHTFEPNDNEDPDIPGCFGHGDYIHDTPAEGKAAYGCPVARDTCTGTNETSNHFSVPGGDPVHNFMDYSDDDCLTHFTPGQILRMQNSWVEGRVGYQPGVAGRRASV